MARKRKTLPKNFGELIEKKDIESLKKVFDSCEIDAKGGYGKSTALSFYNIPNELVRWLVENGADIDDAFNTYERTALHEHSSTHNCDLSIFIELGANVNAKDIYGDTPLHFAAGSSYNVTAVKKLIEHGADINAFNNNKQTPLERSLERANNINLVKLVDISKTILKVESKITQKMKDAVKRLGDNFEFHRENFNKDMLNETDKALSHLYDIYDIAPIKKRIMHDGVSPIQVNGSTWQKQFEEL